MKQFRRFTALLLAVLLITGLFPVHAVAEAQEPLTFETTYINPIYADMVSEEDIPPVAAPRVQTYETVHYVTTLEEAGIVLREQMKARMEAPVVHIFANVSTNEEFSALCRDLYDVAITHTREPNEGDYILWHLSGYKASGKRYTAEGGYNIDITYSMAYHSSAEQEAAVDAAVEDLLSQLNLAGRSDYEKVRAVYDYICKNVRYDKTSSGTLKHTAYAALIKKTAVCQGYASLLYRLLLELGVDTRVIAGSTSNGDHGWNIVELGNLYYNADSTWDEGSTSYSWFLKSPANFPDHNRFAEYTTAAFTSAYPMASADYVPAASEQFSQDQLEAALKEADAQGETYYLNTDFVLERDLVIDGTNMGLYINGSLTVPNGITLTIGNGGYITVGHDGTLDVQGEIEVNYSNGWPYRINLLYWDSKVSTTKGIPNDYLILNCPVSDEKALSDAVEYIDNTNFGLDFIRVNDSFNLTQSIAVPENTCLRLQNNSTLTIPQNCTFTHNGLEVQVYDGNTLVNNGVIQNNGAFWITGTGKLVNNGTFNNNGELNRTGVWQGNEPVAMQLTQAQLEAAMADGDSYNLTAEVTLERDMTISKWFGIQSGGKLIVPEGVKLTVAANLAVMIDGVLDIQGEYELIPPENGHRSIGLYLEYGKLSTINGVDSKDMSLNCKVYNTEQLMQAAKMVNSTDYGWDFMYIYRDAAFTDDVVIPSSCLIQVTNGAAVTVDKDISLTNNGRIEFWEGTRLNNNGNLENNGELVIFGGANLLNAGTLQNNHVIGIHGSVTNTGTVRCSTAATLVVEGTWEGNEPVYPHVHDYAETVTAPTCTQQGYTTYTCSCGETYQDNFMPAAGHTFGSWYETKAPTETEEGEEQRDCNNCDHYETREVAKLDPTNPSGTCGENLTWEFEEETGTLTISGTGEMDSIGFDSANGYPLQPWKDWHDKITSVVIKSGATNIVNYAFSHCENLEKAMIPATVTELSAGAFQSCPGLKEIRVDGENLNYCAMDGILYTKDITTLVKYPAARTGTEYTVPDTVTLLTAQAFEYAATLVSITLPDNIAVLGADTFADCTSLKNIRLPKNLTDMEASCIFLNCSSLESIEIPDKVQVIGSSVFAYCSNLKQVTLPAGLKRIDGHAFGRCESLATITIPAGVNYLEYKIFEASGLQSIIFEGDAPKFHEETFANITATAYYPSNTPTWTSAVMQDYGGDITWVAYSDAPATSGSCGDNLTWNFNETSGQLTVSGSGAMYGADKLGWTAFAGDIRSVEIGNGATSVGAYAFADCENLTNVQMPNSVMRIAYNAFENCSSLMAVDIPDNVTEIAYGAFMDCSSLTAVDIPDNVMEISYSAFKDCTSLASLELPQNVMTISYHAFDNCTSLSEVDFPTSLASIGDEAFGSCTGLDEMRFTGNAPEIQSKAFSKVTADAYYPADNTTWTSDVLQNYGGSLTWIAEGGSVTPDNSCGENITWAFEESTGTLTISGKETMARSNGISVMDDYARPEDTPWFAYQEQIITVIIEGTVDSIGKNAFAGCRNLTTVIIEEGVSEIDNTAFSGCDALENCYFEGTEDQWNDLGADIGESTLHTESAKPEAHTETKKIVAPTCTEQGYDLYTCSCGTIRKDNFTDPAGHKWNDGVVTREPSAQAPGIRTFTCTVCKATRTETIPYEAPVSDSVYRISGKDRVKTALSVAKALKDTLKVDKFDSVIIATGVNEKFADALAGSYLANVKKAPILLYTNSGLSPLNVSFIRENLKSNGTVYILGGDSAVPTTVEKTLSAYNVVRLSGKTRYETNLAILKEAGISGNEILVATGTNFADSLSASAVGLPLLLVNGKNTAPNAVQTEFLKSVAGKKITIIGGDSAVSEEMKASIEKITGVTAERISGKTRHNTSVLIAQKYFPNADFALITYAKNFPDGLAGGPLAYAMGAPLLLTNAGQEGIANGYITAGSIERGYVLGGDSAVSDETARKVFGLTADAAIEKAYYTE